MPEIRDEITRGKTKNGKPLSKQHKYILRRRANEECIICGAPAAKSPRDPQKKSPYCNHHQRKTRERNRKAYARKHGKVKPRRYHNAPCYKEPVVRKGVRKFPKKSKPLPSALPLRKHARIVEVKPADE